MIYHPTVKPAKHLVPHLIAVREKLATMPCPWVCEVIEILYGAHKDYRQPYDELDALVRQSLINPWLGGSYALVTNYAAGMGARLRQCTDRPDFWLIFPDGTKMTRKEYRLAWLDWMISNPENDHENV